MGWTSSYLGGNVTSSYLHIDNLRMDLLLGKFWDSGATKYLSVTHDGTDGDITSSSGDVHIHSAGNDVKMYNGAGTGYLTITPAAASTTFLNGAGFFQLQPTTGAVFVNTTGVDCTMYIRDATGVLGLFLSATGNGAATPSGIRNVSAASSFELLSDYGRIRFRHTTPTTQAYIEMYDVTLTTWKKARIDNGAWVISDA